jgi:5'-hydroxyaverantin dehydrogenase
VPVEKVVDAIVGMGAIEEIMGRTAILMPDGSLDLEDDIWGAYGGLVMQQSMVTVLEKGMQAIVEF